MSAVLSPAERKFLELVSRPAAFAAPPAALPASGQMAP